MLRYVSVAVLLIAICSALPNGHDDEVRFTQSNATLLSIAEELGIAQEDLMDAQYRSTIYGGSGGTAFRTQIASIKTINIRSGSLIDSIELIYYNGKTSGVFGGWGGNPSSFSLKKSEKIVAIFGRSGAKVDSLTFVTNTGRVFGPVGGGGGSSFLVTQCDLKGIFGRSGSLLDAIGFNC